MDRGTRHRGARTRGRGPQAPRREPTRRERLSGLSRGAARRGTGAAQSTRSVAVGAGRRVRRVTHAQGAGESGLGRLIELHGVNTAGDAMIAVALANTLFFSVPTGEARGPGRALPADHDGAVRGDGAGHRAAARPVPPRPALGDRPDPAGARVPGLGARRGRDQRGALALSRRVRLPGGRPRRTASPGRPPCRGCCPRAAPWSRPTRGSRWPASSRAPSGPASAAGHLALLGWRGRCVATFLVFCVGTVLALRLPPRGRLDRRRDADHALARRHRPDPAAAPASAPPVVVALRANGALRAFSGLPDPVLRVPAARAPDRRAGQRPSRSALVAGGRRRSARTVGTTIGSRLKARPDLRDRRGAGDPDRRAVAGAFVYGIVTVVAVAAAAGLAQSLGKLSLDAHRAARRARGGAHLGVRPVRDRAAAVLGRRRRASASRCRSTAGWAGHRRGRPARDAGPHARSVAAASDARGARLTRRVWSRVQQPRGRRPRRAGRRRSSCRPPRSG